VSELNFAVTAQVVLFDRNGAQITSQTVAFRAHSRQAVPVGDLLRQANSAETMGSAEVLPNPAQVFTMAIAAQLSITGSGANAGQQIEEEFVMAATSSSGVLRSAGAALASNPTVALRNTAATAQTATVSCITEKGASTQQQVKLAAGGWALLQACTSSSNAAVALIGDALVPPGQAAADLGAFGLSVAGSGTAGSLAVFGFSWRGAARGALLSSQNFVDAGTFRSGSTVFTGVPVGTATYLPGSFFTPQVALANFGTKPVSATVLFARTTDSGPEPSNVATVSVPAMSSQTIALPLLTGDPGLRNSFIVQSDAAPGTLFASVAAVGAPGFGLVEQIGKDQQTTANGGGHPWDLTNGQDAVLLLFNHSTVPKYFNVKIGNGGVLWQQPYQLAPMETRAVSIRELIAGQVKDQNGKVLPQTLEQGEIGWFNANPAEGKGRLMQVDPASQTVAGNARVARNFSCSYTYVLCGASISPDSVTINDGASSGTLDVTPAVCLSVSPSICSGQSSSYGGLGYTYEWTVNGPAEVSGSSTGSTATLQGTGAGTGSVSCMVTSNYEGSYCQQAPSATLNVTPTITFVGGSNNIAGTTQNAVVGEEIFLEGDPAGGKWSISGSYVGGFETGASGGPLTLVNTAEQEVLFYWVTQGTYSVSYTVSGQSASATFAVVAPKFNSITVTPSKIYIQPTWLRLGNAPSPPPGMAFTGSISPASGYSGLLEWVQIINSLKEQFEFTSGTLQNCSDSGLDNTYPYGNSSPPTQTSAATNDSPAIELPSSNYEYASRSDSFSMYLLWQPALPNAIFVPLGLVNWSWAGSAGFSAATKTWSLVSQTGPSYSAGATSVYPSWAQTAFNNQSLCGEPYNGSDVQLVPRRAPYPRRSSR
jgi:hypothetical protein